MISTRRQFLAMAASLPPGLVVMAGQSDEKAVRAAVTRFFSLLRGGRYRELHELLPSSFRSQTTPEEMERSLRRLGEFIRLESLTIGEVRLEGEVAVAETTITGRLMRQLPTRPAGEPSARPAAGVGRGRVIAWQYLVREAGRWRVASADNRSQQLFFQRHPGIREKLAVPGPRFEVVR